MKKLFDIFGIILVFTLLLLMITGAIIFNNNILESYKEHIHTALFGCSVILNMWLIIGINKSFIGNNQTNIK